MQEKRGMWRSLSKAGPVLGCLGMVAVLGLIGFGTCRKGSSSRSAAPRVRYQAVIDRTSQWKLTVLVKEKGFAPWNIAAGKGGTVYAVDQAADCVWKWDSRTGLMRLAKGIPNASTITVDDRGYVWVNRRAWPVVTMIAPDGGVSTHDLRGRISTVRDVTYDPERQSVVLLDETKHRLLLVDRQGELRELVDDSHKYGSFTFGRASSIACGSFGKIYVLDFQNSILTIAPDGGRTRRAPEKKFWDWSLDGYLEYSQLTGLLIVDFLNMRVLRMTPSGFELLMKGGKGKEMEHVTGLAVDPEGRIYVSDDRLGMIVRLSAAEPR